MENENNSKSGCIGIIIVLVILLALLGSCSDDNDDSKFSYEYRTNKEYREDVDYIADVYGEDPEDVDRKINSVVDQMN